MQCCAEDSLHPEAGRAGFLHHYSTSLPLLLMKTLLLSMAMLLSGNAVCQAQNFEVGLHGGYGSTRLFNSNISDLDYILNYESSFAPVYGVGFGYFSRSGAGVSIEINGGPITQKYEGNLGAAIGIPILYNVKETVNYVEVPVLFRKYTQSGFFFELGPKISFLTGAEGELDINFPGTGLDYEDRDISDGFRSTVISGVVGLGYTREIAPDLYLNARVRMAYGFSDATEEFDLEPNIITASGTTTTTRQVGIATVGAHLGSNLSFDYEPTHSASGHIMVGVSYRLPVGGTRPME